MNEKQVLVLGALLHDIGKFYQRTKHRLDAEDKGLMGICCPHFKERYTHQHVLYSGKFVRNFMGAGWELVENLALYHHLPNNSPQKSLTKIVTLADWLASGERRGREEEEPGDPRKEPILSIFSRISFNGQRTGERYWPLLPLHTDLTDLFPKHRAVDALSTDQTDDNSYQRLWEHFTEEVGKIDFREQAFDRVLSQIFYLLEKYAISIPAAAYLDKPDLSLFHHLKSSAALADCIYQLNLSEEVVDMILRAMSSASGKVDILDEDSCLLVGGDISGIQDFIYSVTSEHALKGLKGRSVYLQLLSEAAAKTILTSFNLSVCNLIYSGGGHFYLLLPDKDEAESKLAEIQNRVENVLLNAHQGRLSVAITAQKLKWKDFMGKNFGLNWLKLGEKLAREKKRKFSTLLQSPKDVAEIFGPYEAGGDRKACEICGEEIFEEREIQCRFCHSFSELARQLFLATAIEEQNTSFKNSSQSVRNWQEVLESLGTKFIFLKEAEIKNQFNIFYLNSIDFLSKNRNSSGFKLLARHAATENDQLKTLNDFANEAHGIEKWGVLRADVDNLGQIFAEGLGDDRTISRVSMLSYMLSLFFTTHVETIARTPQFSEKVYVVYSGGDDLSIIASWSVLPDLALRIYEDFRAFTSQKLTLSAGVYLAPSAKFPVYQATNNAGEALEKAKAEGRNRFVFFDQVIAWEDLAGLKDITQKIVSILAGGVARTLLSVFYSSFADRALAMEGKISMFRLWRLLYALKKLKMGYRKSAGDLTDLENMTIAEYKLKPNLDVAVRWADYLTRTGGDFGGK